MKRTEIEFKTKILKCGREDWVNKNQTTSQGQAVGMNSFKRRQFMYRTAAMTGWLPEDANLWRELVGEFICVDLA